MHRWKARYENDIRGATGSRSPTSNNSPKATQWTCNEKIAACEKQIKKIKSDRKNYVSQKDQYGIAHDVLNDAAKALVAAEKKTIEETEEIKSKLP